MRKGLLMVVSGPSGTGKGTVCSELLRETSELAYSISATTRAPRSRAWSGTCARGWRSGCAENRCRGNGHASSSLATLSPYRQRARQQAPSRRRARNGGIT